MEFVSVESVWVSCTEVCQQRARGGIRNSPGSVNKVIESTYNYKIILSQSNSVIGFGSRRIVLLPPDSFEGFQIQTDRRFRKLYWTHRESVSGSPDGTLGRPKSSSGPGLGRDGASGSLRSSQRQQTTEICTMGCNSESPVTEM